ncbi:hypothetical protein FRC11_011749, partial [Ceratobasidium sp. 423]
FYSRGALAIDLTSPVDEAQRGTWREDALNTIKEICVLADPNLEEDAYSSLISRITLERLGSVLETARFLGELENFTLPRLVAGCIVLMSTVKPSLFYYEYGYLCFKVMVIALNSCLLKHACVSNDTLTVTTSYSLDDCVTALWSASALLVKAVITGNTDKLFGVSHLEAPHYWEMPLLDKTRTNELLAMLHADQKNFSIALKGGNSLGLSGLMYVLWKFVENERVTMNQEEYLDEILVPYFSILQRYRLVVPNFKYEREATILVAEQIPSVRWKCSWFIDLEDSRNLMQAYVDRLRFLKPVDPMECNRLITFIAPLVFPGCEELLPDIFEAFITVLWDSLSTPKIDAEGLIVGLASLLRFCEMLKSCKSLCIENQLWTIKLVDNIILHNVVGIVLRVILFA